VLTLALVALALLGGACIPTAEAFPIPFPRPDLQAKKLAVVHAGSQWKVVGVIFNAGPKNYFGGRTYKILENGKVIKSGNVKALKVNGSELVEAPLRMKPKKGTRFTLVISPGDAKPQNDKLTIVYH
jgi:hypothetical protein